MTITLKILTALVGSLFLTGFGVAWLERETVPRVLEIIWPPASTGANHAATDERREAGGLLGLVQSQASGAPVAGTVHGLRETFIVTAYTAGFESTGKRPGDSGYGITASGRRVRPGICAADPSIPFGTRVRIEGLGVFVVEDRGGAIVGKRIDIYRASLRAAKQFGIQKLKVTVER